MKLKLIERGESFIMLIVILIITDKNNFIYDV